MTISKNKKLVFLNDNAELTKTFFRPNHFEKADKYGFSLEVPGVNMKSPKDWNSILPEYDALITTWGSPTCSADFLTHAPQVQIIGNAAGSVASVVDESTYNTGVKVTTANPVMAESVAEWSLLTTLLAARNFGAYSKWFGYSAINWQEAANMQDIKNLTIGIWGFGDIAKHLLNMLKPLCPGRILVCSNHSSSETLAEYGAQKASLEEVFSESNIIHSLAGVNQQNFERIGTPELAMIKNGATLINAGRARLFQEEALLKELKRKRFNAIIDVFYEEPLPQDSPWNKLENVIYTPHNAGYTGRERFVPFILDEFKRFFNGKQMYSEISCDRFLTMTNEKLGRCV
jgi:phosphoglycerate dehydrogenase-like enzyme